MVNALELTCRVFTTLLTLAVIAWGTKNFFAYRRHIWPALTLRFFYIYGVIALIVVVYQTWTPSEDLWYTLNFLIPNAIIKNCEICFAWCQSLAFLILAKQLKNLEEKNYFLLPYKNCKYTLVDIFLMVGLALCNGIFAIFVIYLVQTAKAATPAERQSKFVELEIWSWVFESLSTFVLVASGFYTVSILRRFGIDLKSTYVRISAILFIFSLCYVIKTLYYWAMYYYHVQRDTKTVLHMLGYQAAIMHVIWDVIPLVTIFLLHQISFSDNTRSPDYDDDLHDETMFNPEDSLIDEPRYTTQLSKDAVENKLKQLNASSSGVATSYEIRDTHYHNTRESDNEIPTVTDDLAGKSRATQP